MATLGIVYGSNNINLALDTPHPSREYECVGLTFHKASLYTPTLVEDNNLDTFLDQSFNNLSFVVHAIFHNGSMFDRINIVISPLNHALVDDNELKKLHRPDPAAILTERTHRARRANIVRSNYQFWREGIGFVYFGKRQLKAITRDATEITISGAEINYGIGTSYSHQDSGNMSYPTLKAETSSERIDTNTQAYLPNVAVGLPCPPIWGSGGTALSVISGTERLESINAFNIQKQWGTFADIFLAEIITPLSSEEERSIEKQLPKL